MLKKSAKLAKGRCSVKEFLSRFLLMHLRKQNEE